MGDYSPACFVCNSATPSTGQVEKAVLHGVPEGLVLEAGEAWDSGLHGRNSKPYRGF